MKRVSEGVRESVKGREREVESEMSVQGSWATGIECCFFGWFVRVVRMASAAQGSLAYRHIHTYTEGLTLTHTHSHKAQHL